MKEICKCDCHRTPLFYHQGNCCENTGKIYLDEAGEIVEHLYKEISIESAKKICPCCGGTGLANEKN
jgi:hypothetical protein